MNRKVINMQHKDSFSKIYFRKFWSLMGLNMVVVLFSLPIVTIGPAITSGLFIARKYVNNDVSIFWQDFLTSFKKNFKQSFIYGLISTVLVGLLTVAVLFYFAQGANFTAAYFAAAVCGILLLVLTVMNAFAYYMIISVELSLGDIIKNAFWFSVTKLGSSLLLLVMYAVGIALLVLLFPLSLVFVFLFIPAFMLLLIAYMVEPVVINAFTEQQ